MQSKPTPMPRIRFLLLAGATLLLLWPVATLLRHVWVQMHWFPLTGDEALHLTVVENLVQLGKYRSWSGPAFAPALTTGPTVLAPAALLTSLLGSASASAARLTVFGYALALTTLIGALGFKIRSVTGAWIALGVFFVSWRGLEASDYFLYGVLGDGPAVFWLLLSLVFVVAKMPSQARWIAAGAASALAVFSKPYLALFPLALLCTPFLITGLPRRARFRALAFIGLGGLIPTALWGLVVLSELGLSGLLQFVLDYPKVMRGVNGAGLPESLSFATLVHDLGLRLQTLPQIVKPRSLLLLALGSFAWVRSKSLQHHFPAARALALTYLALHGTWWFLFSPGVQSRYFLPFLAVATLGLVLTLPGILARRSRFERQPGDHAVAFVTAVLLFAIHGTLAYQKVKQIQASERDCALCRQIEAQAFWKSLSKRPAIYSTQAGYVADLELTLTAPATLRNTWPEAGSPDWVAVGEFTKPGTQAELKARGLRPVFVREGRGFWRAP